MSSTAQSSTCADCVTASDTAPSATPAGTSTLDVAAHPSSSQNVSLPRITITYCTQCRWLLRAAYFAQELLTTFSTAIGEVALIPATGGLFRVEVTYNEPHAEESKVQLLWDRKAEGGFPETKVLKQKVRDVIEPQKNLGHSDKKSETIEKGTD